MRLCHPSRDLRAGRRARRRLLRTLAAALLAAGAARAGEPASLRVAAASSLREPLTQIARRFEARAPGRAVELVFGASSVLALQAAAGAPIDVLISADARSLGQLDSKGRIGARAPVAGNRLVVIASREAAGRLAAPADLASDGVRRVALPARAVPVGHYARAWLARRGLLEAVEARSVRTEDARATLVAVDQGLADAAIVYATDAALARSARVAFEIPPEEQPPIAYLAALLAPARAPRAAAAFLAFLSEPEAQALLRGAGFSPPPPAPDEPGP